MDELDLDINNYELNDILNLFQIPSDFTEEQLKQCKKAVLKTHPDKSGLDKEVFLFFSKAYKVLIKNSMSYLKRIFATTIIMVKVMETF